MTGRLEWTDSALAGILWRASGILSHVGEECRVAGIRLTQKRPQGWAKRPPSPSLRYGIHGSSRVPVHGSPDPLGPYTLHKLAHADRPVGKKIWGIQILTFVEHQRCGGSSINVNLSRLGIDEPHSMRSCSQVLLGLL